MKQDRTFSKVKLYFRRPKVTGVNVCQFAKRSVFHLLKIFFFIIPKICFFISEKKTHLSDRKTDRQAYRQKFQTENRGKICASIKTKWMISFSFGKLNAKTP